MKLAITLATVALLAGCSTTVPVERKFPTAPETLLKECEKLKTIEGTNVSITDMLKVVTENYTLYHECANKNENWKEWYQRQKQTFEAVDK
jgi:DNA-binding transcriptional regulator YbjK